nr:prion-like-(Q/N-rich) domain-bearing protein 25 [Penaeus vannamei]
MCEVRKHEPTCICKHGFVVNSVGEFVCATGPIECRANDECASNLACVNSKCVNPCSVGQPCPPSKQCDVLNHQPVCICVKDCNPSVTICLRDEGCGPTEACVSYQCVDPCASHVCPGDTPCYVEDHKPLCKFCPPGFTVDPEFGCVKAIGCRDDSECPTNQACINEKCLNPCVARNPCSAKEDCKVQNQRATCVAVGCRSNTDCPSNEACVNRACVSPCEVSDPCVFSERCEVRDHIPFCISGSSPLTLPHLTCP